MHKLFSQMSLSISVNYLFIRMFFKIDHVLWQYAIRCFGSLFCLDRLGDLFQMWAEQTASVGWLRSNDSFQNASYPYEDIEGPESERLMTIMQFAIPTIVFLGSVGNVLSILVFFATKLRKLSSSYYLSALAVSDTGFLFCTFMSYLVTHDVSFYNQDGVCQITTYLAQVSFESTVY